VQYNYIDLNVHKKILSFYAHLGLYTGASSTCKALCTNASWSKYGRSRKRNLSKQRNLNEQKGKFRNFDKIGVIYEFCGGMKAPAYMFRNTWNSSCEKD